MVSMITLKIAVSFSVSTIVGSCNNSLLVPIEFVMVLDCCAECDRDNEGRE